jgi:hypothetical protein
MDLIGKVFSHSSKIMHIYSSHGLFHKMGGSHTFKEGNLGQGDKIYQIKYYGKVWNSRVYNHG